MIEDGWVICLRKGNAENGFFFGMSQHGLLYPILWFRDWIAVLDFCSFVSEIPEWDWTKPDDSLSDIPLAFKKAFDNKNNGVPL